MRRFSLSMNTLRVGYTMMKVFWDHSTLWKIITRNVYLCKLKFLNNHIKVFYEAVKLVLF